LLSVNKFESGKIVVLVPLLVKFEIGNALLKGKKLVIVTHMPPFKTMLDKLEMGYRGLIPLREFIINKKPALVLSGHLHENAGKVDFIQNTVLINPGGGKLIEI